MRTFTYDQAVNGSDASDAAAYFRRAVQASLDLRDNGGDPRAISGDLAPATEPAQRPRKPKEHHG